MCGMSRSWFASRWPQRRPMMIVTRSSRSLASRKTAGMAGHRARLHSPTSSPTRPMLSQLNVRFGSILLKLRYNVTVHASDPGQSKNPINKRFAKPIRGPTRRHQLFRRPPQPASLKTAKKASDLVFGRNRVFQQNRSFPDIAGSALSVRSSHDYYISFSLAQPLARSTAFFQPRMSASARSRVMAGSKTLSACHCGWKCQRRSQRSTAEPRRVHPAPQRSALGNARPHDGHAQHVCLELHEQIVARRAAVDAQLGQAYPGIILHRLQHVGRLIRDALERRPCDMRRARLVRPGCSAPRVPGSQCGPRAEGPRTPAQIAPPFVRAVARAFGISGRLDRCRPVHSHCTAGTSLFGSCLRARTLARRSNTPPS